MGARSKHPKGFGHQPTKISNGGGQGTKGGGSLGAPAEMAQILGQKK